MVRKTVGLIVFEQMSADELAGSARAFSRATISTGDPTATGEFPCYQVLTLGLGTARCTTECGIMVKPKLDINDAPPLHTLIVPGGVGIHKSGASKKLARFLRRRAPVTGRVVTFGSGIYPLAATGMLDGRAVTLPGLREMVLVRQSPSLGSPPNGWFEGTGPFSTSLVGRRRLD